ncbi:MAG: hypothetical protein ACTSSE_08645 [Candidatus Thorarchaeota archaeon]
MTTTLIESGNGAGIETGYTHSMMSGRKPTKDEVARFENDGLFLEHSGNCTSKIAAKKLTYKYNPCNSCRKAMMCMMTDYTRKSLGLEVA